MVISNSDKAREPEASKSRAGRKSMLECHVAIPLRVIKDAERQASCQTNRRLTVIGISIVRVIGWRLV